MFFTAAVFPVKVLQFSFGSLRTRGLPRRDSALPILGTRWCRATLFTDQFLMTFGAVANALASCHALDSTNGAAASLPQFEGPRIATSTLPPGMRLRHARCTGTWARHRGDYAWLACHHSDCNPLAVLYSPLRLLLRQFSLFNRDETTEHKSHGRQRPAGRGATPSLTTGLLSKGTFVSPGPRPTRHGCQ